MKENSATLPGDTEERRAASKYSPLRQVASARGRGVRTRRRLAPLGYLHEKPAATMGKPRKDYHPTRSRLDLLPRRREKRVTCHTRAGL